MAAVNKSDFSLSGILPVVPLFDFHDLAQCEAPAAWEYMEALYSYEKDIRPIAHDWAMQRGAEVWERKRPWFCQF